MQVHIVRFWKISFARWNSRFVGPSSWIPQGSFFSPYKRG